MGIPAKNRNSHNDQLDSIIAEYLRRKASGECNLENLLIAAHSGYAKELREFFENEACIRGFVHVTMKTRPAVCLGYLCGLFGCEPSSTVYASDLEFPAFFKKVVKVSRL